MVTDWAMPMMSGDRLAAAIKGISPTPVILVTGFGEAAVVSGNEPPART